VENIIQQDLASSSTTDGAITRFLLTCGVLLLYSASITVFVENDYPTYALSNQFLVFLGGLFFLVFYSFRFALSFICIQFAFIAFLVSQLNSSATFGENVLDYCVIAMMLAFIEWAMRTEFRISWPEAATIAVTAAALARLLFLPMIAPTEGSQERLIVLFYFPLKALAVFIVYLLYSSFPHSEILGNHRQRIDITIFSLVTTTMYTVAAFIFFIMAFLTVNEQVTNLFDSTKKQLKQEGISIAETTARTFRTSERLAIQLASTYKSQGNDDYFNEQSELIRQVAPFISEVKISASGETAKSIYTHPTVKYPFDTTREFFPCLTTTSIPCEQAIGRYGSGIYRLSLGASKYLLFYVNFNYALAYNRPVIARHKSGEIFFQSKEAQLIDLTHYYTAKQLKNKNIMDEGFHRRAWIIFSADFPEFGMKWRAQTKNRGHYNLELYQSLTSGLDIIAAQSITIGEIFLAVVLIIQIVSVYYIALASRQMAVQLLEIEQWFLQSDYDLNVKLSRLPEMNQIFKRIQNAAYAQRRDITEKMELGRLMLLEHNELTEMVNAAGAYKILLLSDDGEIIIANASARELLNVDVGKNLFSSDSSDISRHGNRLLKKVAEQCEELKSNSSLTAIEDEVVIRDASENDEYWLIAVSRYRGLEATTGSYRDRSLVFISNIDELVAARSQSEHSDRLSLLGETVAGMAHEMNQPLNVITLAAENCELLIQQETPDKEKIIGKIHRIKKQVERAATLITRIKGHGKAQEEDRLVFDVSEAVHSVHQMLAPQLELDNISLNIITSKDYFGAKGAQTKLEQVISNIVINARDAIVANKQRSNDESIVVKVDGVHKTMISISNYGPEISANEIGKIFNPFFTTKMRSDDSGLGLGLAICARLVNELSGTISVESRDERTTFIINLPNYEGDTSIESA
jgi:signal transduction histidine kinase